MIAAARAAASKVGVGAAASEAAAPRADIIAARAVSRCEAAAMPAGVAAPKVAGDAAVVGGPDEPGSGGLASPPCVARLAVG